jgi:hypothetical protein
MWMRRPGRVPRDVEHGFEEEVSFEKVRCRALAQNESKPVDPGTQDLRPQQKPQGIGDEGARTPSWTMWPKQSLKRWSGGNGPIGETGIYLHRTGVSDVRFEELDVGADVRFVEEVVDGAIRATSVVPLSQHGRSHRTHGVEGREIGKGGP